MVQQILAFVYDANDLYTNESQESRILKAFLKDFKGFLQNPYKSINHVLVK